MSKPIVLGAAMNPPFKLTPLQRTIDANPARFKILKIGRRGSKTYYEAFFLAKNALKVRGKHWYVTTTLALAREELFPVLLDLLPSDLIAKIDDRLLYVRLTNGSTIYCKSAEKEKNLRGRGLASVVIDEAAFLRAGIWDTILRPQLAGSRGPALIASSTKRGWFTQLFDKVKRGEKGMEDWACFKGSIYDNPHISPEEIEAIKASTPINTWLSEYMSEDISDVGQVYEEFDPSRNVFNPSERFTDCKTYLTIRGIDWGLSDDTGVVWIGVAPDGSIVISEEHAQNGWSVNRHAGVIHGKSSGYKIAYNILDKSAFRKEGTSLTSIADQFRDEGIACKPSDGDVNASLDIVKRFFSGGESGPWLFISAKCTKLITALSSWEHGDHEPDIAAAMRYGIAFIVTKKMTKLADHMPISAFRPIREDHRFTDAQLLAMAKAPRPKPRASGFSWDHEAGAFA